MNQALINFVKKTHNLTCSDSEITIKKLYGQASAREYFRVSYKNTKAQGTRDEIIMKMPSGFSSPAEEVTKTADGAPKELPFINVQKYLNSLEIPVPQILGTDEKEGLLLIQDLEDTSLELAYQKAGPEFGFVYYKKVIDLLAYLQNQTLKNPSKDCIASYRFFDKDLLNWEFDHFLEYGIEDRFSLKLTKEDKLLFEKTTRNITNQIIQMPQGFVMRDFQSRNIMLFNFNFFLIDFQDALTGPLVYDLVSLLRDSYIAFNENQTKSLINYYLDRLDKSHPYYQKQEQLFRDFYLMTLQRKLKDTGRFQFILTQKNNPDFIKHVPQSLTYVKNAFNESTKHTEDKLTLSISKLQNMISQHIEEIK